MPHLYFHLRLAQEEERVKEPLVDKAMQWSFVVSMAVINLWLLIALIYGVWEWLH